MKTDPKPPGREPKDEFVPDDDRVIGQAFRWSLVGVAVIVVGILLVFWLRRDETDLEPVVERGPVAAPDSLDQRTDAMPFVEFRDITRSAGIQYTHSNGAYGAKLLPETHGGGVAFLDYDGDGDQDLLFVNSDQWPERQRAPRPTITLYRNDGSGRFEDVTRDAGLDVSFYGQGVAVGDHDGDGDVDLFLTALGPNRLFVNEQGRFRDVTDRAGVAGEDNAWSTSAGFLDYDNDGDLDLFVCNYVRWSRELDLQLAFTLNGKDRAYGPPKQYPGTHSYLYRNEGDGTFREVSAESGVRVVNPATGNPAGKALAVTFVDIDDDGLLDILVANDTVQNFVFRNVDGTSFDEIGATSGVGFDGMGNATGAMGIDAAGLADDEALGIAIANFANEHTSLYLQQADPWQFVDVANAGGVGSPSRLRLSFGLFFFDYDLDGRLDLLQANGHLEDEINQLQPSQHYRQPAQLFWNCSTSQRICFASLDEGRLGELGQPVVGRGAAYADIDLDGDLDIVIGQNGGPPLLVRNDQQLGNHWLRVALVGTTGNRDAIGARVELRSRTSTQTRVVMPTRSYLSQVELPVTFGLGPRDSVESLVVHWPDGQRQTVEVDKVDTTLTVVQGS